MNERFWIGVVVCLTNAVIVVCFVMMAVYFNHWWIALFSILCTMSYKDGGDEKEAACVEEYEDDECE